MKKSWKGWLVTIGFMLIGAAGYAMKAWSEAVEMAAAIGMSEAVLTEALRQPGAAEMMGAMMENGEELAKQIYEDIGIYLAHTIPFYAKFYDVKHMLLLGRVMGGKGGDIVLATCKQVLAEEYPAFAGLDISLPDEKSRRVGQSIAAASLPADRE